MDLGLKIAYDNNLLIRTFIEKTKMLCLLPADHISPTFESLSEEITSGDQIFEYSRKGNLCQKSFKNLLSPFITYFKKEWIEKKHAEDFSVYMSFHRTNNAQERYHKTLNQCVGTHSTIAYFVGMYVFICMHVCVCVCMYVCILINYTF